MLSLRRSDRWEPNLFRRKLTFSKIGSNFCLGFFFVYLCMVNVKFNNSDSPQADGLNKGFSRLQETPNLKHFLESLPKQSFSLRRNRARLFELREQITQINNYLFVDRCLNNLSYQRREILKSMLYVRRQEVIYREKKGSRNA